MLFFSQHFLEGIMLMNKLCRLGVFLKNILKNLAKYIAK